MSFWSREEQSARNDHQQLTLNLSPFMEDRKKWYVVYTKPRWEKKVYSRLLEKDMEAYCPLNKVQKKWSDRMKIVEEPLFKSYVFVHIHTQEQSDVRMINGVVNYVYWQGKPAVVQDQEIETIRKFLNEYSDVEAKPMELKTGMKVKIQRGALMEQSGEVLSVEGNKVRVNIESIGYSLVASLERSNLRMGIERE